MDFSAGGAGRRGVRGGVGAVPRRAAEAPRLFGPDVGWWVVHWRHWGTHIAQEGRGEGSGKTQGWGMGLGWWVGALPFPFRPHLRPPHPHPPAALQGTEGVSGGEKD